MEDGGQQWTSQVLIGDDCKLSDCLDTTEILYLGHQHSTNIQQCTAAQAFWKKLNISRHNRIMFLYCIVVVPIPGGCGWCGCRDKISFCKQSKFVPAQCPHTLPTAPSLIMWGTTAANNIYRMGSKYGKYFKKKIIPV